MMETGEFGKNVEEWWRWLDDNRGDRARLRRCANLSEVAFVPAFHRLRRRLPIMAQRNEAGLITVAALVSHVKEHRPGMTFAQQMGTPKSEGGNARVSGLRFRRLLQHRNHEELLPGLVRTIHLLGGAVNLHSLADGAYWWNDNTKKQWAIDYYETAPDEK